MAVTVRESRDMVSDFVKNFYDERYCFVAAPIKNVLASIAAGALTVGMPLKNNAGTWETLAAANIADAEGFLADERKIPAIASNATTAKSYRILTNGPAVVNSSIVATDPVGAAITQSAVKAALRALSPKVEILVEPTNIETQTT